MTQYYVELDEDEDIRQGDVIKRTSSSDNKTIWGFIITADCDIAQNKAGNKFTMLEIVSTHDYMEDVWAPEQIRKLCDKQALHATELINSQIRKLDQNLMALTPLSLCEWLSNETVEDLLNKVIPTDKKADKKLISALNAVKNLLTVNDSQSNLKILINTLEILGRDKNSQNALLKDALDSNKGFSDFFVIPEIPEEDKYGFVILLRSISSVNSKDLFSSELQAKINGRPDAYYRVCRLNDGLRFAVSQKLAFLFSRIGMPVEFEEACETVANLFLEDIRQN